MLVLSRRSAERIILPDIGVTVRVVSVKGNVVRIGIEAPPDVKIVRAELLDKAERPVPAVIGLAGPFQCHC